MRQVSCVRLLHHTASNAALPAAPQHVVSQGRGVVRVPSKSRLELQACPNTCLLEPRVGIEHSLCWGWLFAGSWPTTDT